MQKLAGTHEKLFAPVSKNDILQNLISFSSYFYANFCVLLSE